MKRIGIFAVLCGLAVCAQTAMADSIGVNFQSTGNASISFGGGNFTFLNSTATGTKGFSFDVNGATGLPGDSFGDLGNITGTYTIGAITTTGSGKTGISTAQVTGSGVLSIVDGAHKTFSADLQWVEIEQQGTETNLNDQGIVNLSNVTYSGSSVDLLSLKNSTDQTAVLSFSFTPFKTLATLKGASATHPITDTFSGAVSALPEPGFYGVLCVALMSLVGAGKLVAAKARRSEKS